VCIREEREVLSEAVSRVRSECEDLRQHSEQAEAKRAAAERVVAALRDALREERALKNRADTQYLAIGKVCLYQYQKTFSRLLRH
jgi:flagellar motility protein MotE (MotC chaperone)